MFTHRKDESLIPTARRRPGVLNLATRAAIGTLGVLAAILTASPAAGFEAYTVRGADLLVFDLASGGEVTTVGDTGLLVLGLGRGPAGDLWAAAKEPGIPENPVGLYRLDPATGAPTLEATLDDMLPPSDMTFDAFGGLWLTVDGDLYAVDPASGATTPVGGPGGSLRGLAARGGELYGIEGPPGAYWRLVRVDPASGATVPIASLPDLELAVAVVMDFDASGRLWILAVKVPPITAPPFTLVYRAVDLTSGELESVVGLGDGGHEGLAVAAPEAALAIPALDRRGILLLAGLLLAAALYAIRRRPPGVAQDRI